MSPLRGLALGLVVCAILACEHAPSVAKEETAATPPYDFLSSYGFFQGELAELVPSENVLPYTVISPLWSDNAAKARFIVLPEGGKIDFDPVETWSFPQGTTIIKTFLFPEDLREPLGPRRIIETRLLVHEGPEWKNYTYIWNEEQTEARKLVAGTFVDISYLDSEGDSFKGTYVIPNTNQCKNCHSNDDRNRPIGPSARQLNTTVERDGRDINQILWLEGLGIFSEVLPDLAEIHALVDPAGSVSLDSRARSYLDSNCAHCHRPGGDGGTSGLVLLSSAPSLTSLGLCKKPVAAGSGSGGLLYDIVPGKPEESILLYRMQSLDPQVKMPEIPNLLVDEFGVELIREWILAMEPVDCFAPSE